MRLVIFFRMAETNLPRIVTLPHKSERIQKPDLFLRQLSFSAVFALQSKPISDFLSVGQGSVPWYIDVSVLRKERANKQFCSDYPRTA